MENFKEVKKSNINMLLKIFSDPNIFIVTYLFYSKNHEFFLKTRIQKAFFLFLNDYQPELKDKMFKAFHFGPYSSKIDNSLYSLISKNYISHEEFLNETKGNERFIKDIEDMEILINFANRYFLNREQEKKAENMIQKIKKEFEEKLFCNFENEFKNFIENLNQKNINKILEDVYNEHPYYAKNSILKKEN